MMNNLARIGRNARGCSISISRRTQISSPPSHCQLLHQFSTRSISSSPHPTSPAGIAAVIQNATKPSHTPRAKIFDEFALHDRVAIITGGNQNLGLEQSLALSEAGVRAVYCIDLPSSPSEEWNLIADYVEKLGGRLEYISADVTNQKAMWDIAEQIGDKEGRLDICIAGAAILGQEASCLDYAHESMEKVMAVNVNGALYTAQAAGRQMTRFGLPGSIIICGSIAGSTTIRDRNWVGYNASKCAILQMARSMACELGMKGIRVNTLSAGQIQSGIVTSTMKGKGLADEWATRNTLGRLARLDEMRGVTVWLASDASSYCTGSDIEVNGGYNSW